MIAGFLLLAATSTLEAQEGLKGRSQADALLEGLMELTRLSGPIVPTAGPTKQPGRRSRRCR